MSIVRLYTHSGWATVPGSHASAPALLRQPYLGRQVLVMGAAGTPMQSDASAAPAGTAVALIQASAPVHLEVTAGTELRIATTESPVFRGDFTVAFGPGWRISALPVIDADTSRSSRAVAADADGMHEGEDHG